VAAVPGDGIVPLSHGSMRSSSADRERAIDVLKAAFAEGRLDQDEYTTRVGQVYASRTYGDLAVLTADLPAGPLGTLEQPKPLPAQLSPAPPVPPIRRRRRQGIPLPFLICLVVVLATAAGHVSVAPAVIVIVLFVMLNIVRWLR
jgi:hypothetical protein